MGSDAVMEVSLGRTVLVVDDEAAVRLLGERILRRAGYAVMTAPDGETALEMVREPGNQIGLVMLDLQMPGMGGQGCLTRLRAFDVALPVVVTTGGEPDPDTEEVVRKTAQATLKKPYELSQFLAAVREFLPAGGTGERRP
jgi:CheY-like chemotaxis protein